jgi:hypothetical protein
MNEKITPLWTGYSTGRAAKTQSTPSLIKFTNSKSETIPNEQKHKIPNKFVLDFDF